MHFNLPRLAGAIAAAIMALPLSHAAPVASPLERAAPNTVQAEHRVLLGLARAGARLVAVGERGLILLSDDDGKSWRQAKVPVSISLTASAFATTKSGWAVGHAGVVLHTEDGGETWRRQLDGIAAGKILLDDANAAAAAGKPDAASRLALAKQFVDDGPDKPFLDLQFFNERSGIVVGAYGLILRTDDAGKSWQPMTGRVDNPKGLHIYAIRVQGESIWLAGEQGFLAHSADGGQTFTRIEAPYRGSYFTLAAASGGDIIIGGLKGNVFRSSGHGTRFEKVEGFLPISLSAALTLKDGSIVFSNQAGQVFISRDGGRSVQMVPQPHAAPLNAIVQAADGSLVVAGVRGIARLPVNPVASGAVK